MRAVSKTENQKYGCAYCADMVIGHKNKIHASGVKYRKKVLLCPYEKCDYPELDNYESYLDYLNNVKL